MPAAHTSAISIGLLRVVTHVTPGASRQKMIAGGVQEAVCLLILVPDGHKDAVWIEPIICTIEYIPSDKEGYRQAEFKGFRDDKLPRECLI